MFKIDKTIFAKLEGNMEAVVTKLNRAANRVKNKPGKKSKGKTA